MALGNGGYQEVFFHGIPGLKFTGLTQEVDMVKSLCPKIVFLEKGTNDLASGADAAQLAVDVLRFANHLSTHFQVGIVTFSLIVFRD